MCLTAMQSNALHCIASALSECESGLNPITVYHCNHPRPPLRGRQIVAEKCAKHMCAHMCVFVFVLMCVRVFVFVYSHMPLCVAFPKLHCSSSLHCLTQLVLLHGSTGVENEVRVNNDLVVFNCKVIPPQPFDRKQGK